MKIKISPTSLKSIPLIYLLKSSSKIPLDLNYYPHNSNLKIYTYQTNYQKSLISLKNNATVLINTDPNLTPFEFEVLTSSLKNHYKFTFLFPKTTNNLKDLFSLITALNPKLSLIIKIKIIIKYYLLKTILHNKTFLNNISYLECSSIYQIIKKHQKHKIKKSTPNILLYNPLQIDLRNIKLKNFHYLNHQVKLTKIEKYSNIFFVYEKYNPQSLIYLLSLISFCKSKKLSLNVIKV